MDLAATGRRLETFFRDRIWSVHLAELPRAKSRLYRASRVLYSTYDGFRRNRLTFRAAALTYYSVLSLVPFLAVAFSVLKGLGAYKGFMEHTVLPYLHHTFGGNPALVAAIDQVLRFVDQTDVSRLGWYSSLLFVYTSISLLSNVETALNDVWGARANRPLVRQVTDYTTLIVTTPILLLVAAGFVTAAANSHVVEVLRDRFALGPVIYLAVHLVPVVLACLGMVALFIILPNVHTQLSSALLGGVVSGVLWQITLTLHVRFQAGVAQYNALYSGFAAVPIFLVWTYVSWLAVLLGAQLAASHQQEPAARQHFQARHADQAFRESLAIAVVAQAARDFVDGCVRCTSVGLAEVLEVPTPVLDDVLEALVRAEVLARVVSEGTVAYLPARDIDKLHLEDVRDAVRRDPSSATLQHTIDQQLGDRLRRLLDDLERRRRTAPENLTLRELAQLVAPRAPAAAPTAVLDPKQPEVPA